METAERASLTVCIAVFSALATSCVRAGPFIGPAAGPASETVREDIAGLPPPDPPQSPAVELQKEPEAGRAMSTLVCAGPATQGGAIVCRAQPDAAVFLDAQPAAIASADGLVVIGLSRDAPREVVVSVGAPASGDEGVRVTVLPRRDTVSKFTMECGKIAPQTPEQKRHAEVSWVKKDRALRTFSPKVSAFGFVKPADGPYSSPFGAVRTYVPKTADCDGSTSVHNGQDIAVPVGTEVRAPMGGTVILADPDLFFEGGAVFVDHGMGLVSVMMHLSRIDVVDGARVEQGDVLGLSGATGRVTGPHLHWAIKYRNVHSGDRGTDIWLDPVLIMALEAP